MRFTSQCSIAFLAALVSSKAIPLEKRAPALDVKLSAQGNTLVKAVITNTGSSAISVLNKGTFLDEAAIEKVTVSSDCKSFLFSLDDPRPSQQGCGLCAMPPCDKRHACLQLTSSAVPFNLPIAVDGLVNSVPPPRLGK